MKYYWFSEVNSSLIDVTEQDENFQGFLDLGPVIAELRAAIINLSVSRQSLPSPSWTAPRLKNKIWNTVNSRYLEFQGTLWNTSRYPYLEISELQKWGKQ